MDFLRKLFSSCAPQNQSQIVEELHSATACQVHLQASSKDQSLSKTSIQNSFLQSSSKITSLSSQIQTKILQILQISQKQTTAVIDCGTLVGVIGLQKYYQQIFQKSTMVKVGYLGQINSLGALRKKSLDSLMVFYSSTSCQFDLEQILLAEQRLIFVVQQSCQVKNLISNLQSTVLQLFHDRSLLGCSDNLYLSIMLYDQRYYLEFKNGNFFLEHFKTALKKIKVQFQSDNQARSLMKRITLQDYVDFCQLKQSAISKILNLKYGILREIQDSQKEIELNRTSSHLSTCENEEQEYALPDRKNSQIQADLEAQYFKKRISQKKTGQSQIQYQIYNSELFYFIEERDSVENYSDSSQKDADERFSNHRVNIRIKKYRSKSQKAIEDSKIEDLDDEFFTKY